MTPADKRIAELLDRWLASVELHAGYLELDDAAYAEAQDWPKHQRPTRWVVELARARLLDLKRHVAEREARGDGEFGEALELMSFLTTLLGSEHVERSIPLATRKSAETRPAAVPQPSQPPPGPAPGTTRPRDSTRTQREPQAPPPEPARATPNVPDKMTATVMADAVRFLNWGREWPQLASLIARLADRPGEQEILKILRKHRAAIEAQARRAPN